MIRVHKTHKTAQCYCNVHNPATTAQQNKLFIFTLLESLLKHEA